MQETSDRAMDRMADTAKAFAEGQEGPTVIVVPDQHGSHVVSGPGAGAKSQSSAGEKVCPNCGNFVEKDARHCRHCGHKFEGIS